MLNDMKILAREVTTAMLKFLVASALTAIAVLPVTAVVKLLWKLVLYSWNLF